MWRGGVDLRRQCSKRKAESECEDANRIARKPPCDGAERRTERDGVAVLHHQRLDAVIEAHLYCCLRHILHHVGACGGGAARSLPTHKLRQRTPRSGISAQSLSDIAPQPDEATTSGCGAKSTSQHECVGSKLRHSWAGTVSAKIRLPGALGCHRRHALHTAASKLATGRPGQAPGLQTDHVAKAV